MSRKKWPPLQVSLIIRILLRANFVSEPGGNHDKYVGFIDGKRRVVPVSRSHSELQARLVKAMVAQSGLSREQFFGLTRESANIVGCEYLENGLS